MKNGLLTILNIALIFGIAYAYYSFNNFIMDFGNTFAIGFGLGGMTGLFIVNFYVKMVHGFWP